MLKTYSTFICVAFAIFCTIGVSCKKDNPVTPNQLGHTLITFQVTFTSTRWCRLNWTNDSTAASHRYLLIRNNRDTIFNDSLAAHESPFVLQDTVLKPGTNYSYWIYRIVNGTHWDSASVTLRTLDTTRDNLNWETMPLGLPGSVLHGIWGPNAHSIWVSGLIDSSTVDKVHRVGHWQDGSWTFYDTVLGDYMGGCFGTSDSDVWFAAQNALFHWDGHWFTNVAFIGDSLPYLNTIFLDVWVTPDGREVWGVGNGGNIVHRRVDGKWEVQQSGTTLSLTSIRGFSNHDIFVSSVKPNCDGCEGNILHYDGLSWTELVHGYLPPPTDTSLLVGDFPAIGGESHDSLYAVGERIYKTTGKGWQLANAPCNERNTSGCGARMESTSGNWNNMWIVGDFGWMMHFNGERWKTDYPFFNSGIVSVLAKVITIEGEVFVVGQDHTSTYLIHGK